MQKEAAEGCPWGPAPSPTMKPLPRVKAAWAWQGRKGTEPQRAVPQNAVGTCWLGLRERRASWVQRLGPRPIREALDKVPGTLD